MRAVLDINVLISGLLKVHTPPARIIDMVLLGRIVCAFDDRILAEYAAVLQRPKFGEAILRDEREYVLEFIREQGHPVVAPPIGMAVPDQYVHDLPFVEVAVAGGADFLVTGNTRHFEPFLDNRWGLEILAPHDLVSRLCQESEAVPPDSPSGRSGASG